MKRNIINGIMLISALALGSCSTSKLASNQLSKDDDVYYSDARAGDQPEYVSRVSQNPYNDNQSQYNDYKNNDDDYYYYDSYASRINRFGYLSPFGYYDDMYYGYSPYYNSYYNGFSPYYGGFGLGIGLGYGYGYSPFYSPYGYYGYGMGGLYSPYAYSYWGSGYGGYPYWGVYSAYNNSGTARPYRAQRPAMVNGSSARPASRNIGYNGNYPNAYMGRPTRTNSNGSTTRTNSTGRPANEGYSRPQRPTVEQQPQQRPTYQPQTIERSSPPPSSSGGSSGGGRSSSGGGGRPARP